MNTSQQNPHNMSLVIDGIQPSSNKGESHSELYLCQQNKALHDELNQLKHKIVQLETLNSDIEDENERFNKSNDFLKHYVKNLSNLSDQYKCLYEIYHSSHSDLSNVNNEFMKQQIMNSKNYDNFLSKDEQKTLKLVNEKSNLLKEKKNVNNNFFNKSVKDLITEWSYHHQNMLDEVTKLTKKMNSMQDVDKTNSWWNYLKQFCFNFIEIITKDERLIYTGITIVFISLLLYLIDSSS